MARDGKSWIQTATGKQFWPMDPRPEDIDIRDIAHHLSHVCRYSGACNWHYSVAQHSVLVSQCVPPEDALYGLLHDASEAYLHDLPKPLKNLPEFAFYRAAERRLELVIAEVFGLPTEMPESVKLADLRMLPTEKRDIMGKEPASWGLEAIEPYSRRVENWSPTFARASFCARYAALTGKVVSCG